MRYYALSLFIHTFIGVANIYNILANNGIAFSYVHVYIEKHIYKVKPKQ